MKQVLQAGVVAVAMMLGTGAFGQTPEVGQKAPEFTLSTPDGKPVSLGAEEKKGPVVLVLLRGFPGYQCPYCTKQVHDFVEHADDFAKAGAEVLLVYPGPPEDLSGHAGAFLAKQNPLPGNVKLTIDPDYKMTNQYGLRWEGAHETAYPSTFLIDRKGVVFFRKISKEHGDRTSAVDLLGELKKR